MAWAGGVLLDLPHTGAVRHSASLVFRVASRCARGNSFGRECTGNGVDRISGSHHSPAVANVSNAAAMFDGVFVAGYQSNAGALSQADVWRRRCRVQLPLARAHQRFAMANVLHTDG